MFKTQFQAEREAQEAAKKWSEGFDKQARKYDERVEKVRLEYMAAYNRELSMGENLRQLESVLTGSTKNGASSVGKLLDLFTELISSAQYLCTNFSAILRASGGSATSGTVVTAKELQNLNEQLKDASKATDAFISLIN